MKLTEGAKVERVGCFLPNDGNIVGTDIIHEFFETEEIESMWVLDLDLMITVYKMMHIVMKYL